MNLTFDRVEADHGSDDYETGDGTGYLLTAYRDGTPVSWIEYEDRDDHLHVRWVETVAEHRGRGYAHQLLDQVDARHPGQDMFTASFTDLGETLRGRIHEDPDS